MTLMILLRKRNVKGMFWALMEQVNHIHDNLTLCRGVDSDSDSDPDSDSDSLNITWVVAGR